ncbi:MAG: alpha/beta hydrolase [Sporichthyaceae bacterium]
MRRLGRSLAAVLYALVVAAVLFLFAPSPVSPQAFADLRADPELVFTAHDDWYSLLPAGRRPSRGLVFYPGGHTDPRAYAPTWAPIVKATGTAVFLARVPLFFAPLEVDAAAEVIEGNPGIDRWWVGGHSFGGFAALDFLDRDAARAVEGVVLWAAYPLRDTALRPDLRVLVVLGGRDGIVPPAAAREALAGRPVELREIAGMEHSQFGDYSSIFGDGDPAIDDAVARAELAAITGAFLGR